MVGVDRGKPMSYQVLARKWRPRRFEDLVGQDHVVRALVNALDNDRLHHAFLFTGTRGVGKTTIARILAKSLNCEEGVSSKPCGKCRACVELDEGRFVDLIEVDAASRTKVDDTRELLDNVQYAPTRGRYKVYLIDEVHMLSGHSFNALLKTLEEPPPHVKFLLATTDPQKLPVTVLSRCLQFNLVRLTPEQIGNQLEVILGKEGIDFEASALGLLAEAADGSMRDGLSLLDQAIAFGGGAVRDAEVREMLGTIDQDVVWRLVQGLAENDASMLMASVDHVARHSMDFASLLEQLLLALHRVALAQADAQLVGALHVDVREHALAFAARMAREDVQLYYQIGLIGRRDLPLAPDPRSGLEMVLLRMLAFRPQEVPVATATPAGGNKEGGGVREASDTQAAKPVETPRAPAAQAPEAADVPGGLPVGAPTAIAIAPAPDNWAEVVASLGLTGVVLQLANNAAVEAYDGDKLVLVLDQSLEQLRNREREGLLKDALAVYYGRPIRLELRIGTPSAETPAAARTREDGERQQAAQASIDSDPNITALKEQFDAHVSPQSIRPR
jgi:DNA polymerase-3 subunit gamma/tau